MSNPTPLLSFAKPERAVSVDRWRSIAADGAPPGVYTPNMNQEDRLRWKAKLVGSRSQRHQIEIRTEEPRSNMVLVVNGTHPEASPDWCHRITISANGPMEFVGYGWDRLQKAVQEAQDILRILDAQDDASKTALQAIRAGQNPLATTPTEETP